MAIPALEANELVDDRALASAVDDEFGHSDFVGELEGVIRRTPTPQTMAVYAPWGGGKTSIAHLLKAQVKDDPTVSFARFDASKYAEMPLRRHFISQVATELRIYDDRFHGGLYRKETENRLELPMRSLLGFVAAFLMGLLAFAAIVVLASALYGLLARGSTGEQFRAAAGWLGPKAVTPAGLLGLIGVLASRRFVRERTVEAPASDEEFEARFKELVLSAVGQADTDVAVSKRRHLAGWFRTWVGLTSGIEYERKAINDRKGRLVVFVDELDRCTSKEVTTTLESLRTFFEIDGCILLVAADQQVLEEALMTDARQATPASVAEPYYSSGTAYLDKVFHPQLFLPPLKQQRLSQFALKLVEGKPGAWKRLRDADVLEDAISVLVPTHVHSPRRIKALLNAFLLLYRVAWTRADQGTLAGNTVERAPELAKLSCLRVEFPHFARDLALDARMPSLVLSLLDEEELPKVIRDEVRVRAEKWATKTLGVADVIHGDEQADSEARKAVAEEHADQLLRYLRKTRRIGSPGRDLVYLESAGASLTLDSADADAIEEAAVDGDVARVVAAVEGLDAAEQLDAIRLLASIVRDSAVGIEGENAVSTLLRALSATTSEVGPVADEAARAVSGHRYSLNEEELLGAFSLSLASSPVVGAELGRKVRSADTARSSQGLLQQVVECADQVLRDAPGWVGDAFLWLAVANPKRATAALESLPDNTALEAVGAAAFALEKDEERVEGDHESFFPDSEQQLQVLLETMSAGPVFESVLLMLLRSPRYSADVQPLVGEHGPYQTEDLAFWLLDEPHPSTALFTEWLSALPPDLIGTVVREEGPGLLTVAAGRIWKEFIKGDIDREQVEAFLEQARRYRDQGVFRQVHSVTASVTGGLTGHMATDAAANETGARYDVAKVLVELGAIEPQPVADAALQAGQLGLSEAGVPPHRTSVGNVAAGLVADSLGDATDETLLEALTPLVQSPWQPHGATAALRVAAELRRRGVEYEQPLALSQLRDLATAHGSTFSGGFAVWLGGEAADYTGAEVASALDPIAAAGTPIIVDKALRELVHRWDELGRAEEFENLVAALIAQTRTRDTDASSWEGLGWERIDETSLAKHIGAAAAARDFEDPAELRRLLDVARALDPTAEKALRPLVTHLLKPAASKGGEFLDIALAFSELVLRAPSDRRAAFRKAARASANEEGRGEAIHQQLKDAGLIKRRLLRRDEDV